MPRDKAQLAPDVVLAEISGGTGQDTSDARQGSILKGVGNEGGLELADPRLFASTANAVVANSVAETTLKAAGVGSAVLLANALAVGRMLRLSASGIISTAAIPGTTTFRIKLNAITLLATAAYTFNTGLVNESWILNATMTCRAVGILTGSLISHGYLQEVSASSWARMSNTVPIIVNTTIAQTLDMTVQWSIADAANSINCTNFLLELL